MRIANTHPPAEMPYQLVLSAGDLRLLIELLEQEEKELLKETRHSHHRSFRAELRESLETIESLIARARAQLDTHEANRESPAGILL